MINLKFSPRGKPLKALCLGAHSDDIEIGCGGTVLKLLREYKGIEFDWVVFSASGKRRREALASASAFLPEAVRRTTVVKTFRDGYFPYNGGEIKDYFEMLKCQVDPDLIFTHYRSDLHQDHRLISELTWNTFRNHLILEYEIPKYDGDLGTPNVYVHLDEAICQTKIRLLFKFYKSQAMNAWFDRKTFLAIMRLRGIESNAPAKYAESFFGRKMLFS